MLALLFCFGCARAATTVVADAGAGDDNPAVDGAAGMHAADAMLATGVDGARPPEAGAPDGDGFIPPSRRDGGIPRPPAGSPPCAPDSMAGDGNVCLYKSIVGCTPVTDARPVQVCYCFAPPLDGKWHCEAARGDGGPGTL